MSQFPYGRLAFGGSRTGRFLVATLFSGLIASTGCVDDNENSQNSGENPPPTMTAGTTGNDDGPNSDAECVGIAPSYSDQNSQSGPRIGVDTDCPHGPGTCVGDPMPTWLLEDVSPSSCGFGQTYGLDTFKGNVVVVALLAGW